MRPTRPTQRPAGVRIGDARGLTATGAVTVALGFGTVGATIDAVTGSGLRTTFALLFVIPPLAYLAIAFVSNLGAGSAVGGSFLKQQGLELAAALITKAPALLVATGLAATIAVLRRGRRP
jgi:hypothetical protein